jgi:uncharacterized membrane protein
MDIKGLRTLNLVGTVLFCILGIISAAMIYIRTYLYMSAPIPWEGPFGSSESNGVSDSQFFSLMMLVILWLCVIIILTIILYIYTVKGLDRRRYKDAKFWTLIGCIFGLAGGIIPFIIFLISYVSFDDAVRTHRLNRAR